MKKILLLSSLLCYQLFAVECTKVQYGEFFNNPRYLSAYTETASKSQWVFDKKTIAYNKDSEKIQVWTIGQDLLSKNIGIWKIRWSYDIPQNKAKVVSATVMDCRGATIKQEDEGRYEDIVPNSGNELTLDAVKAYLNIK